jgi:LPXTG-motif cell wall-anchored protein
MSVERGWGFTSQMRLRLAVAGEPGLADLGRLFSSNAEPETASAYLLASMLIADLRQRRGADAPGAIVRLVSRGIPFPRAFEMHTGETPEAAAARLWRRYQEWTSWIPVVTGASALWIAILGLAVIAFVASRFQRRRRRAVWDDEDFERRRS